MMRRKTVQQLLQVFNYARANVGAGQSVRSAYQGAVHKVAEDHGVTYQTIGDGCRRRLLLDDIRELYAMLQKWVAGHPQELMQQLLKSADPDCHSEIRDFFRTGSKEASPTEVNSSAKGPELFMFELERVDALMLKMLCEVESTPVEKFLSTTIKEVVRDQMRPYMQDLLEAERPR